MVASIYNGTVNHILNLFQIKGISYLYNTDDPS